jgi:threonine/homoserine/homoserine lactone efflux protein
MIELVPLALVITVSPASIIPAVLLLHTPQPRPSGLAYLAGWLLGLGGLTAVCIGVSSMLGGVRLHAPEGKPWLRIAIGIALIAFGAGRYLTRHGRDGLPGWMQSLHKVTPARAGLMGAVLALVNPKVLLICAAAGLAIGSHALGITATVAWAALFVAVAGSSVAVPVLAYVGAGERVDPPLQRFKLWMEKNNATFIAAMLLLIGLWLLYRGIHDL